MKRFARLILSAEERRCAVDPRLYGSFVEHLGRCVYTGIYEPGHPTADENGFREDVLELVKPLRIPAFRYPGGAYASGYYWEDTVGPNREATAETVWQCVEPNTFGIDEFCRWTKKVGGTVTMTLNLATRGIRDALNLLEYCNLDTDTRYARMRRANGSDAPYNIKTWCLGNELGAPYELGQKTAEEYGRLAAQTSKAMKMMDPSIETVACGSPFMTCATYPRWDYTVLREAYEHVDYIGIHQYLGHTHGSTAEFLAGAQDLDAYIGTVESAIRYVKALKKTKKDVKISFDEWNVWKYYDNIEPEMAKVKRWSTAPAMLESVYTAEDAVMVGLFLIQFLKHADTVTMANQSELVNTIGLIMTEPGGGAWTQSGYYPFLLTSQNGRGSVLHSIVDRSVHDTEEHTGVNDVETVAVMNDEGNRLTVFAVNTTENDFVDFEIRTLDAEGFRAERMVTVGSDEPLREAPGLRPLERTDYRYEGGKFTARLAPCSWNMICFTAEEKA